MRITPALFILVAGTAVAWTSPSRPAHYQRRLCIASGHAEVLR